MVHLNHGLSVGIQTSIVLNDGILQMLTMCLKSLKASKKLYAVGFIKIMVNIKYICNAYNE